MSTNREPLFKKFDAFIFKQVDLLKASPFYLKLQEPLSMMDEDLRLVVNNVISLVMIIVPFVFIGFFAYMNYSMKQDIQVRKDILKTGQEIIVNRNEINNVAQGLLSNAGADSDMALAQRMKGIASSTSIDPNKISVSAFLAEASFAKTNKINATIGIMRFSANDLANLLSGIINREKMKISGMSLRKSDRDSQIEGTINVTFNAPPGMTDDGTGGGDETSTDE